MSIDTELGDFEGSTMKQSSKSGPLGPNVNGVVVSTLEYTVGPAVGIPHSLSGRYELVASWTTVPSMVGPPERLKYLFGLATFYQV